ncbi:hypothetical protein [Georgenia sp. MJ170]|uniref:hypothetical protein n=1 Tax=Georgenia sunbinii TaxID=3117728 RepID=UPI002F2626F9
MLLVVGPSAAWGVWNDRAALGTTTASAGSVAAPVDLQCRNVSGGLLQTDARITWQSPPEHAGAEYRVLIDNAAGDQLATMAAPAGSTEVRLSRGLLVNLLGGLLELLLGSDVLTVSVVSVHPSGWISAPVTGVGVTTNLLGVYCA